MTPNGFIIGTTTTTTPSSVLPNVLFGCYSYTNPCKTNPNDPSCMSQATPGTTTGIPPSILLTPQEQSRNSDNNGIPYNDNNYSLYLIQINPIRMLLVYYR